MNCVQWPQYVGLEKYASSNWHLSALLFNEHDGNPTATDAQIKLIEIWEN